MQNLSFKFVFSTATQPFYCTSARRVLALEHTFLSLHIQISASHAILLLMYVIHIGWSLLGCIVSNSSNFPDLYWIDRRIHIGRKRCHLRLLVQLRPVSQMKQPEAMPKAAYVLAYNKWLRDGLMPFYPTMILDLHLLNSTNNFKLMVLNLQSSLPCKIV